MMAKQPSTQFARAYSGSPWEQSVGYCRAIRVGNTITVSGTVAVNDDGSIHAENNALAQTKRCYEIIANALGQLGGDINSIVRSRMYVTNIARSAEFGEAHTEMMRGHHPCLTMVQVAKLIRPAFLVEIEVDAVVA